MPRPSTAVSGLAKTSEVELRPERMPLVLDEAKVARLTPLAGLLDAPAFDRLSVIHRIKRGQARAGSTSDSCRMLR